MKLWSTISGSRTFAALCVVLILNFVGGSFFIARAQTNTATLSGTVTDDKAAVTFGSSGRNVIIGPNLHIVDFSVNKLTKVTERAS